MTKIIIRPRTNDYFPKKLKEIETFLELIPRVEEYIVINKKSYRINSIINYLSENKIILNVTLLKGIEV